MQNDDQDLLSPREKLFADSYLTHLNKSRAAAQAGYASRNSPYQIYNRPRVRQYIEERLNQYAISAAELTKLISDTAQGNLTDYFRPVQKIVIPKVTKGLQELIDNLQCQLDIETEYLNSIQPEATEKKQLDTAIRALERDIARLKIELDKNPNATRIVDGEPYLSNEMQLDIEAVVADKERCKVKSIKYSKTGGYSIEMYSALDAQEKLAKMHGLYKKDNEQSAPQNVIRIGYGD
ncbi:terminase small subunit [Mucilaginibacter paludis]|uniref:Terminase small subunit n=1 Tax=Mucilaginibacter paludis DSM 18603 TaxID=714943 RepID=H1Y7Q2_9SPHI|nr:terminase small subunit [Mucilaginibacter paludis]EHQ29897.1 hypothetical protein Mucpa_5830 [Mucilaginibacter paludis DSM 18603]